MRNFGLIGYPLSHSFSKRYFGEKFKREGIGDCIYENYPLADIADFRELVRALPALEGLNVTIPYKQAVIPLIDGLDPAASEIGAVNTIRFHAGKATGYNTDVIGFERSLTPLLSGQHRAALVLGTGGASRAVTYALRHLGIAYRLVSRKTAGPEILDYGSLDRDILATHTLIINTTPVGTSPDVDHAPAIPYGFLGSGHLLYDLVYNPSETLFLRRGKERGALTKNGYQMLELQAEASWDIWNRES